MKSLSKLLEQMSSESTRGRGNMSLWFERERLRAFGRAMLHDEPDSDGQVSSITEGLHGHCSGKIRTILQTLSELETGPECSKTEGRSRLSADDVSGSLRGLVQSLWDILPEHQIRMVELQWIQQVLDSQEEVRELEDIGLELSSRTSGATTSGSIYQLGAALATMKKIRMEILSNPSAGGFDGDLS